MSENEPLLSGKDPCGQPMRTIFNNCNYKKIQKNLSNCTHMHKHIHMQTQAHTCINTFTCKHKHTHA